MNPVFGMVPTKSGLGRGGKDKDGQDKDGRDRRKKRAHSKRDGPHPEWQSTMVTSGKPAPDAWSV